MTRTLLNFELILTLVIFIQCSNAHQHSEKPLVLLVSFDGFRWDYLNKHNLENFNSLKKNGSHADYIHNQFTTATFPSHYTIITGQYQESHGIISNNMYDRSLNKSFNVRETDPKSLNQWFGQNPNVMPLWTLNQKAGDGRRSASNWIGANAEIGGHKILALPFNESAPFKNLIDQFIGLFTAPIDPINFGALYFYEPDMCGHLHGPDSEEMKSKLLELDGVLGYLIQQLRSHHLYDKLNLIITSDHGMETVSENTAIFLNQYVDINLFQSFGSPTSLNLFVKRESDVEIVYNKLKTVQNLDVYKKDEIPDLLFYKKNNRVGDILIVAKLGYTMWKDNSTKIDWQLTNGQHGYIPSMSMLPIFIGHGPAFKVDKKIAPFRTLDLYPLISLLLDLTPGQHSGDINLVLDMIVYREINIRRMDLMLLFLIPLGIIAFSLFIWLLFCLRTKSQQFNYDAYNLVSTNERSIHDFNELDDTADDTLLFKKNSGRTN